MSEDNRDHLVAENERLRAALGEVMRQPCGHDCPGHCRRMKFRIVAPALERERP